MSDMNLARCGRCRETFYIGREHSRRLRCPICSERLETVSPQPADVPVLPLAASPLPVARPGSYERGGYPSIAAFVRERPQRIRSRERDLGLRWRDGSTIYRAAWIRDTGEVYLVQLGAPETGGGHVELLGSGLSIERLEAALTGWRDAQDEGERSLAWFRTRIARLTGGGRLAASAA